MNFWIGDNKTVVIKLYKKDINGMLLYKTTNCLWLYWFPFTEPSWRDWKSGNSASILVTSFTPMMLGSIEHKVPGKEILVNGCLESCQGALVTMEWLLRWQDILLQDSKTAGWSSEIWQGQKYVKSTELTEYWCITLCTQLYLLINKQLDGLVVIYSTE